MIDGAGKRYDSGKPRVELLPSSAIEAMANVFTQGAEKYGDRNWERGMDWSRTYASMMRHMLAIGNGQFYDQESGQLHLAHIMANAAFLIYYHENYIQGCDLSLPSRRNLRIGYDIDGVLADFLTGWKHVFGEDVVHGYWQCHRDIGAYFESMSGEALNDIYAVLDAFEETVPFEPVAYITHRPVPSSVTEKWLHQKGFPQSPVHTVKKTGDKVETAKNLGINVFVEDNPDTFLEMWATGIICFLIDKPYNQWVDAGKYRITHLKNLLDHF